MKNNLFIKFIASSFYVIIQTYLLIPVYSFVNEDTFIVTLIIFITGSFSSAFSFLYLVVIIYSSMLLYRKGSMVMVGLCGLQYSILVALEYYGVLKPFVEKESLLAANYDWTHVYYKVMITIVGCLAVAFLTTILAEQARKKEKELWAMEDHVKRVEKMAVIGELGAGLAHEIKNPLACLALVLHFSAPGPE